MATRTITYYSLATGEIAGHLTGGDYEIANNVPQAHGILEGHVDPHIYHVVLGAVVEKPKKDKAAGDQNRLR